MNPPSRAKAQMMRLPTWMTEVVLLKLFISCIVEIQAAAAFEPVEVKMIVRYGALSLVRKLSDTIIENVPAGEERILILANREHQANAHDEIR